MTPEDFYESLPDQEMNCRDVALGDVKLLEARGLIGLTVAMGDIGGLHIRPRHRVREAAEELKELRASRSSRRTACREAMLSWLCQHDAMSPHPEKRQIREEMLNDPRRGIWLAEPFTESDLDQAAAWLQRQGFVDGISVDEAEGPVALWLTDAGAECAERFDSVIDRYREAKNMAQGGTHISIGGDNHGQVAGDHAHQVQSNGLSAEHLRELIAGLAELVATVVPDASDVVVERDAALAAAEDGAVDGSVIRRFAGWVLGSISRGASAAIASIAKAGTDDMLREAGRLTGHL